jgi:release factor glutamine methyltransferase
LNTTQTVRKCWLQAQQQLIGTLGLDTHEAKLEAQLLLQNVLKVDRAWLIAHENDALGANIHAEFQALLLRRLQGEPIAYILGYREFYGLNLQVAPATLIPRPDTETLVEAALEKIPLPSFRQTSESSDFKTLDSVRRNDEVKVLDLGTGTGAIALAIAKHRPQAHVTAVDTSKAALEIAQSNAQSLSIPNIEFVLGSWFNALADERFDLIVSNPPYIEQDDAHLSQGDLRFEPITALASGPDGLSDIRQIVQDCLVYLKPQGWLMLEHGFNQSLAVSELMAEQGLVGIATIKDLGGNDRVTIAKNPLIVSTHWD